MGKAAREARQLAEQAGMAADLGMLKLRPMLIAGFGCDAIEMMTPQGKTPGCQLTFHMQNGDTHGPIVFDPVLAMTLIAHMTNALTGAFQAPDPPVPADQATDLPVDPNQLTLDNITPSGLIVP
jgi:hypothetical protein